ncbi:unnamed protein product [Calypogeia fissa]
MEVGAISESLGFLLFGLPIGRRQEVCAFRSCARSRRLESVPKEGTFEFWPLSLPQNRFEFWYIQELAPIPVSSISRRWVQLGGCNLEGSRAQR